MKRKEVIAQYLVFRKSLGECFAGHESVLKMFGRQMGEAIDLGEVCAERVNVFWAGTGPVTSYWHRKYGILRGLHRQAMSRGLVAASPLPTTVPKRPDRFVPYIYTREELGRLLDATTAYRKPHRKLEPHTLRAILRLLQGAGLRVGEAVALTLGAVDLPGARITVRDTKFHKTRLVPLGPQLNQVMTHYLTQRHRAGHSASPRAPFFVLRRGAGVRSQMVRQTFKQLPEYVGIGRRDGARYQPRLHDLRHSFAVHRLRSWYRQGADVQKRLPQLSTYLGHVHIAATPVYLTMTPELLQEASLRFERYAFAEVRHD